MAQFVAGQALGMLTERTALRKLADSPCPAATTTPTCSPARRSSTLFRWRHEHLLEGAARRLKGGIDAGRDPFAVLVDCQDHVVEAARAWVDLVVLESFAEAVGADELLDKLCSLYALHTIEAERGYYQEHGRLTGARSKAVIKAVNALCAELRPHARELVDAFGVPENVPRRRAGRGRARCRVRTRLPRAERERQMLDTARALFAARGYADVTMDEVAAAVGVTKPLLYNYFGNKEQLFLACMKPAADALVESRRLGRAGAPDAPRARCATASTRSSRSWTPTARRGGCCTTRRSPAGARSPRGSASTARAWRSWSPPRCRSAPRAAPSSRCRSPSSAPPRRSAAGGCAPVSSPPSAPPNS